MIILTTTLSFPSGVTIMNVFEFSLLKFTSVTEILSIMRYVSPACRKLVVAIIIIIHQVPLIS